MPLKVIGAVLEKTCDTTIRDIDCMGSIFEVGEGIVELSLQFEDLSIFDHLNSLKFFSEVEDIHGADLIVILRNLAINLDAPDGVVHPSLFPHGGLCDIFLGNDLLAEHSLDVWHWY